MYTEFCDDCIAVYAKRLNLDGEPTLLAVASVQRYSPSYTNMRALIDIKTCRKNELQKLKRICLKFINEKFTEL